MIEVTSDDILRVFNMSINVRLAHKNSSGRLCFQELANSKYQMKIENKTFRTLN